MPSSDIDSGLVWVEAEGSDPAGYVQEIAAQVMETLAAAGWHSDTHGATAVGSFSARSATDRQRAIGHWLGHPDEDKVLMAISILLDSRTVDGPDDAFDAIASLREARDRPFVVRLLLRLALAYKPPIKFLRDIVVEQSGEHRGSFDIKRGGQVPIVDIARYAAVAAGATETSTVGRLPTPERCPTPTLGRLGRRTTCLRPCGWSTRCASSKPARCQTTISTRRR